MKSVKLMFAVIGVVVGLAVAMWLVSVLPGSLNPFSETTHDRSQPAVLKSISDLGELRTASANLQIVIDVEKDTRFLPDFIKGERDLFVAVGSVDAGVDLTNLPPTAITVDGTTAKITLPDPVYFDANVDLDKSYLVSRQRGVVDRVASAFGSGEDQRAIYSLADTKLRAAAAADPQVIERARANTRTLLSSLLSSLGFTEVTITFTPAPTT